MTRLDTVARAAFLDSHPGWEIAEESLYRTFTFFDFAHAMAFVTRVAIAAERADHHPDIAIRWNRVTLTLSTHSEGVLTDKDTVLAAEIGGYV